MSLFFVVYKEWQIDSRFFFRRRSRWPKGRHIDDISAKFCLVTGYRLFEIICIHFV